MIVKAKHTPKSTSSTASLRSSSRYYRTREGLEREAFSRDKNILSKEDVNKLLEHSQQEHQYRLVLNKGDGHDPELDLKSWTRDVMQTQDADWLAYEHRLHSDHDHVHVIALSNHELTTKDYQQMRELGDQSWQQHKDLANDQRDMQLELSQGSQSQGEDLTWSRD